MEKCHVIAVTNQKGGVGKTTTTVNLGVGLARMGKRVLLVDADPQGSLTVSLGVKNPDELPVSIATVMQNTVDDKAMRRTTESFITAKALICFRPTLSCQPLRSVCSTR